MTAHWYVFQVKRAHDRTAAAEIVGRGFPTYLPMEPRERHHNHRIESVLGPRLHPYLFARFDADADQWADLLHDVAGGRAGIVKALCDPEGRPVPVPDRAMEALWKFQPRPGVASPPRQYQPGEAVTVYYSGVPVHAIFVGYERGHPMVRLWIFGRETLSSVAAGALMPDEAAEPQQRGTG